MYQSHNSALYNRVKLLLFGLWSPDRTSASIYVYPVFAAYAVA